MKPLYDYNFYGYPAVCSGLKALETIPRELRSRGASHPLVITYEKVGSRMEGLLASACEHAPIEVGPVYRISREPGLDELEKILAVLEESENDSIIAMGSGIIQSVAKVVNMLYSCGITFSEVDRLPLNPARTIPHVAVLDSWIDGREATNRLVIDEYRLHHDALYPDFIVIDNRLFKYSDHEALASGAVLTLTQLCEAYRKQVITPQLRGWAKPGFHFLAGHIPMDTVTDRVAIANAAVAAQIAHSNIPYGPVTTLSEMFSISGFCTEAQASAALLPYFLHQLDFSEGSSFSNLIEEMRIICDPFSWDRADQMILDLNRSYEKHFHCAETSSIIASLVRQTYRLMKHTDKKEVRRLIEDLVANTASKTIMGGEV